MLARSVLLGHAVRTIFCSVARPLRVTVFDPGPPGDGGAARRDFAARALIAIMKKVEGPVNLGSGQIHTIREIVDTLVAITGLQDRVSGIPLNLMGKIYRAYE